MSKKSRAIIMTIIIAVAVIAAIFGIIFLPDTVVTQVSFSGQANSTMPKALSLIIPFAISSIFSVVFYNGGEKKHLLISLIGLVVYIITFAINLI